MEQQRNLIFPEASKLWTDPMYSTVSSWPNFPLTSNVVASSSVFLLKTQLSMLGENVSLCKKPVLARYYISPSLKIDMWRNHFASGSKDIWYGRFLHCQEGIIQFKRSSERKNGDKFLPKWLKSTWAHLLPLLCEERKLPSRELALPATPELVNTQDSGPDPQNQAWDIISQVFWPHQKL